MRIPHPHTHEARFRVASNRERSRVAGVFFQTFGSIAALAVILGLPLRSLADIPLVYSDEDTGTNCTPPPLPSLPPPSTFQYIQPLPDPFCWASDPINLGGTRSTNFTDWECRRNEIMAQIEAYEIGPKPTVNIATQVTAGYSGGTAPGTSGTLTVYVTVGTNTLTLTSPVAIPAGATAPYPVVIGMNSPNGSLPASDFSSRGIATVTYVHNQVTTYGSPSAADPYYKLYGGSPYNYNINNTGQYSAWAWGVSRLIDGLSLVTNTLPVDLQHICVTGCSYAGKMALFSGAFDERIALTVAQESGGGGDTSWRYSHTEPSGTVELIDNTDYNWFANQMQQFGGNNVSYLPEDHHELMAMCAPRALYCTANTDYTWLSNPSAYVCGQACARIYATLGIADRFGFNVDGGHAHCSFPSDQEPDLQYFLNRFMKGTNSLSQTIRTAPSSYAGINYGRWMQWWGSSNPIFPDISLKIPASATEGDGVLVGQGSVGLNSITTTDMVVYLTSSDTNSLTVPASATIAAGQSNVLFDLTVIDDSLLNGDRQVSIIATAPALNATKGAYITIHDNDTAALSVTLPASASESAGTLVNAGTVSIATAVAGNIPVSLTSSDTTRLIVPATTVLSTGQTSAVFNVTFVNNNIIEGSTNVSVTAHVQNWTDGTASMTILDDDLSAPFHFTWSPISSPQLIGEPIHVTISTRDPTNNMVDYRFPAVISALSAGQTPGTNTLLNSPSPDVDFPGANFDTSVGYSFTPSANLVVTHFRHYFGDKISLWTDNGAFLASQSFSAVPGTWTDTALSSPVLLMAGATYRLAVHFYNTNFYWSWSLPAVFADGTIDACWSGPGDSFPNQADDPQWYFVDLRYSTNVSVIPVTPLQTATFSSGTWSGDVAVLQPAANVVLEASSAFGQSGASAPFDVLGTPELHISSLGNSVVLSWPAAAAGFNLYQSPDLANWTAAPLTPAIAGDHYFATNSIPAGSLYYRLRQP